MKLRLADKAYALIQKKIITLEFEPGGQLDENQLSQSLGIGRTPIREALLKLSSEFIVESVPKKGFIVKQLAFRNVKSIFEALRILEMGIANLAVQQDNSHILDLMQKTNDKFETKITKGNFLGHFWNNHNFHMYFADCSKNDYLIRALRSVRNEVNRLTFLSFNHQNPEGEFFGRYNNTVYNEHQQIIDYLKSKNLKNLKNTIEIHIQSFQKRVVEYLTS